ncbi:MAG: ribonuclease P [Desulfurococcus sp.]|nr:ribonuclease P [Desulfurococcus sp.]
MFIDVNVAKCNEQILRVAERLGYSYLACSSMHNGFTGRVKAVGRVVVKAESVSELKRVLAGDLQGYVSIVPLTVSTARWSSHDGRIDSIMMTGENLELFDKKQFRTMKIYRKPLEVSMRDLTSLSGSEGGRFYRRLNLAVRMGVQLVVGSGAEDWWDLLHPRVIVSFLKVAYDIPETKALMSITATPAQIMASKTTIRNNTVR